MSVEKLTAVLCQVPQAVVAITTLHVAPLTAPPAFLESKPPANITLRLHFGRGRLLVNDWAIPPLDSGRHFLFGVERKQTISC